MPLIVVLSNIFGTTSLIREYQQIGLMDRFNRASRNVCDFVLILEHLATAF